MELRSERRRWLQVTALLVALSAAVLTACTPEPLPKAPLLLRFPGDALSCPDGPAPTVSPEAWERDQFASRIRDGRVEIALNANCVARNYTRDELERYAADGDPVAGVVWVMARYNFEGAGACADLDSITATLTSAYDFPNTVVPGPVSRVPEAAYLLALIRNHCLPESGEFDRLTALTYELGYDVGPSQRYLVE